jgi:outer membrane biosynthesis protein TonB
MIEQPQVEEPDTKPDEIVEEPEQIDSSDEPPPGPLGLDDAAAEGPGDLFNLAGRPGGRGLGEGGGRAGTRWGWYATIITQQVEAALRANPKTRHLVGQVQVRLWADGAGRVSRVQIVSGSGNAEVDAMISGHVLGGIMLREPPPADMPMPIVTRITGRKST